MNPPKIALICGGAASVFDDYEKALKMFTPDGVFVINDVVAEIENVDFFCSMHPVKSTRWLTARHAKGWADPKSYWTTRDKKVPTTPVFDTVPNTRGGSGLLAVSVARYLGFQRIVLAGIPLTIEGAHFFDKRPWKECGIYRIVWERNTSLKEDVRSFSGWTAHTFGPPTKEWLEF